VSQQSCLALVAGRPIRVGRIRCIRASVAAAWGRRFALNLADSLPEGIPFLLLKRIPVAEVRATERDVIRHNLIEDRAWERRVAAGRIIVRRRRNIYGLRRQRFARRRFVRRRFAI